MVQIVRTIRAQFAAPVTTLEFTPLKGRRGRAATLAARSGRRAALNINPLGYRQFGLMQPASLQFSKAAPEVIASLSLVPNA